MEMTTNNSQSDLSPWSSSSVSNPQSNGTANTTAKTTAAGAAMVSNNNNNSLSSSKGPEKHRRHDESRSYHCQESHDHSQHNHDTGASTSPYQLAIANLSSAWCLPAQGTGALAVCLWDLPYPFPHSRTLAIALWVLTLLQLLMFLIGYTLRAFLSPRLLASRLAVDNAERACLACIPVTFCTCVQIFGSVFPAGRWALAALGLWWFGFLLSIVSVVGITQSVVAQNPQGLGKVLPSFQMPVVAVVTCAAVGGTLCTVTDLEPRLRQSVVVVSYLLLGLGMPLAVFLDVLFLARLVNSVKDQTFVGGSRSRSSTLNGPTGEGSAAPAAAAALALACQQMILAGPWGQGSAAMQQLGQAVSMEDFQVYNSGELLTTKSGPILGYISMFMGFLSWGEATLWWIWSLLAVWRALYHHRRIGKSVRFEMAFWALVFPWGVYTHSAEKLVDLLDSPAFRVWSTVLFLLMFIIWLYCTVMTILAGRRLLGLARESQPQEEHARHAAQVIEDDSADDGVTV